MNRRALCMSTAGTPRIEMNDYLFNLLHFAALQVISCYYMVVCPPVEMFVHNGRIVSYSRPERLYDMVKVLSKKMVSDINDVYHECQILFVENMICGNFEKAFMYISLVLVYRDVLLEHFKLKCIRKGRMSPHDIRSEKNHVQFARIIYDEFMNFISWYPHRSYYSYSYVHEGVLYNNYVDYCNQRVALAIPKVQLLTNGEYY